MKLLCSLCLVFTFFIAKSQDAPIKQSDTLYYKGEKYYKGLVIRFGDPSHDTRCTREPTGPETNEEYRRRVNAADYYYPCKDFAFIWLGSRSSRHVTEGAPGGYSGMRGEIVGFESIGIGKFRKHCITIDMFIDQHIPIPSGFFNNRKEQTRRELIPDPYKSISDYSTFTIEVGGALDSNELLKNF